MAEAFGFEEIQTPTFEATEVFDRSLGESSDVISKEMFTWSDQSGRSLSLRPENTASVARALVSSGLIFQRPQHRLYYHGSMYRHERPQKGRYREFTQFGVEFIGANNTLDEVEVIAMAHRFLTSLGFYDDDGCCLHINTLGDELSREKYHRALSDFFSEHRDSLSKDSRARLDRGSVLRILDSKAQEDHEVMTRSPLFSEYLTPKSKERFSEVLDGLGELGIAYTVDQRLVRGLDYYSHTVFEFVRGDQTGSGSPRGQVGTILAGGRYDGLIETLGGPSGTPAIGWAAGVDRLQLLLEGSPYVEKVEAQFKSAPTVLVIPIFEVAHQGSEENTHGDLRRTALSVACRLRNNGYTTRISSGATRIGKQMKQASRDGVKFVVLIGEEELCQGQLTVKNMRAGSQLTVDIDSDLSLYLT